MRKQLPRVLSLVCEESTEESVHAPAASLPLTGNRIATVRASFPSITVRICLGGREKGQVKKEREKERERGSTSLSTRKPSRSVAGGTKMASGKRKKEDCEKRYTIAAQREHVSRQNGHGSRFTKVRDRLGSTGGSQAGDCNVIHKY